MSVKKDEIKKVIDETGHAIDDKVEQISAERKIPKAIVWLGLAVVVGVVLDALGVIQWLSCDLSRMSGNL